MAELLWLLVAVCAVVVLEAMLRRFMIWRGAQMLRRHGCNVSVDFNPPACRECGFPVGRGANVCDPCDQRLRGIPEMTGIVTWDHLQTQVSRNEPETIIEADLWPVDSKAAGVGPAVGLVERVYVDPAPLQYPRHIVTTETWPDADQVPMPFVLVLEVLETGRLDLACMRLQCVVVEVLPGTFVPRVTVNAVREVYGLEPLPEGGAELLIP